MVCCFNVGKYVLGFLIEKIVLFKIFEIKWKGCSFIVGFVYWVIFVWDGNGKIIKK